VNQFFLALGSFFLVRTSGNGRAAAGGLALGTAAACRPTGVIFLAAVVLFQATRDRRRALWCAVTAAVPLMLVGAYNQYYFGSPLSFAQELVGHQVALQKTGSDALWQTPLWLGLSGLLVSPSRGLLLFSPILGLSFWGMARIWRRSELADLRPLTIGTGVIMLLQASWFDWWGGWTYGYRPWLDVVPYLVLFLIPVLDAVVATRARRVALGMAFVWSVFVQGLGALSYDRSWNARRLYVVRLPSVKKPFGLPSEAEARAYAAHYRGQYIGPTFCDIDNPICRYRLWSVEDSILVYQWRYFSTTRGMRLPPGWSELSLGK
jgi:hypothetical protein